ncbi:glycosyl hydrolase family 18 protein [Leptospira jelokensis]|uniref:glycosyl hydrolase family 18 protein n=1 Tax=Leptospira jelokensis TaxID=2484931 RepID=UPI0010913D4A|nr:glycosyl hydrolase family 18 protein [Leptospira jelokensis]TGM02351.1 glycosyl hydrolase [Leptospira jelokensis]
MFNIFFLIFKFSLLILLFFTTLASYANDQYPLQSLVFTNQIKLRNTQNLTRIFVSGKLQQNGSIKFKSEEIPYSTLLMIVPQFSVWNKSKSSSFSNQYSNSLKKILSNNQMLGGIVLDAEFNGKQLSHFYTEFVCDLYQQTKKINPDFHFYLAIFPPDHPDQNGYYDLQKLFVCSDHWIIMFYDEHSPRTAEGPVSSSNWIHTNLKSIETQLMQFEPNKTIHTQSIPNQQKPKAKDEKLNPSHPFSIEAIRKKIYLGLPLYGYAKLKSGQFGKVVPIQHWMHLPEFQNAKTDYVKFNHLGELHYLPTLNFLRTWEQKCIQGGYAGVAYWREEFGSTYLDH